MELFVKESVPHDREGGEEDIVELVEPLVIERLPTESRIEAIPELREHEYDVLVEDVADQESISSIGFSSMSEEKILQELELADSIIR